uniref:Uncharacterized protein n=1 Tax=Arundo donax TaxID=35708 RepID=A0A0A8ZM67_ARUDO
MMPRAQGVVRSKSIPHLSTCGGLVRMEISMAWTTRLKRRTGMNCEKLSGPQQSPWM